MEEEARITDAQQAIVDCILKSNINLKPITTFNKGQPNVSLSNIERAGIFMDEVDPTEGDIYVGLLIMDNVDINQCRRKRFRYQTEEFYVWEYNSRVIVNGDYINIMDFLDDNISRNVTKNDINVVASIPYDCDHPFSCMIQDALRLKEL